MYSSAVAIASQSNVHKLLLPFSSSPSDGYSRQDFLCQINAETGIYPSKFPNGSGLDHSV
jgi:hypothetical protein